MENVLAKGYCSKHYRQFKKYGYIPKRTRNTPNEIRDYGKHVGIVLFSEEQKEVGEALIDKADLQDVRRHKWHLSKVGYPAARISGRIVYLHQYLYPKRMVDHISWDTLDNRRTNLRYCTHAENLRNRPIVASNTSGVSGVSWNKRKGKWLAQITVHYKAYFLGYYDDINDAMKARRRAEKRYFKDFAPKHEGQSCRT